jgi:hypothetical protein
MELGIRLSFVKTSEFWGVGVLYETAVVLCCLFCSGCSWYLSSVSFKVCVSFRNYPILTHRKTTCITNCSESWLATEQFFIEV